MKYLVISTGCAECLSGLGKPLIIAQGPFDTLEDAKRDSPNQTWVEHPQGGLYVQSGQGEEWIVPVPDNVETFKPYEEA